MIGRLAIVGRSCHRQAIRYATSSSVRRLVGPVAAQCQSSLPSMQCDQPSTSGLPLTPPLLQTIRSFSSSSKPKKKKPKNKKGHPQKPPKKRTKAQKKAARRKESERQKRHNDYQKRQAGLLRMKNLHPAAKWKRILSACDYWFSTVNLKDDSFLRDELSDYKGHVRISTLASFPKLQHWADTEDILVDALDCEAAEKRFKVIFNRELVEKVARNRQRQIIRQREEEKEEAKQRKRDEKEERQELKDRIKELEEYIEAEREKFWRPRWQELKEELRLDDAKEEKERQKEKEKEKELERQKLTATERWTDSMSALWAQAKELVSPSSAAGVPDNEQYEDGDFEDSWGEYYHGDYEEELCRENEEFEEALHDLEVTMDQLGDLHYRYNDHDDWQMRKLLGKDYDNFVPDREKDLDKVKAHPRIDSNIDPKDYQVDEELPSPIVDDGSNDYAFALVRPKKLNPHDYEYYSASIDDFDDGEEEEDSFWEGGEHDLQDYDQMWDSDEAPTEESALAEEPKPKNQKKKGSDLKKYSSPRQVRVVKNPKELASFCGDLKASLDKQQPDEQRAIGFDVEYCTLEMDIRNTLPAMLQLASPQPNGLVGLIWLDKFENHGKNMIGDKACEGLLSLLKDPSVSKVGVGASKDAKHLAAWWGITDKEHASYYFSGIVDIEVDVLDDRTSFKNLAEMCKTVLERDLPKLKEKNAQAKKERRKKGKRAPTSHWRRGDLTKDMKQYAANDASAGIDIWLEVQKAPAPNDAVDSDY